MLEKGILMLKRCTSIASVISLCLLVCSISRAQSDDPPKFEVGIDFSSITKPDSSDSTEPGLGGRFTFNINKTVALEAATYFFPRKCFFCDRTGGTLTEGLFGVKVGKRFAKWGIFAKARPGFASFSQGDVQFVPSPPGFEVVPHRTTNFAFDLGGVLEFYPSRRIMTRFEIGDTMIHYGRRTINFPTLNPTGDIIFVPINFPAITRHNFQFSAGVGFRF
jgi:hypothetical protein